MTRGRRMRVLVAASAAALAVIAVTAVSAGGAAADRARSDHQVSVVARARPAAPTGPGAADVRGGEAPSEDSRADTARTGAFVDASPLQFDAAPPVDPATEEPNPGTAGLGLRRALAPLPSLGPATPRPTGARALALRPASPGKRGIIYLTFDDGPRPGSTEKILSILREHHVTATFFIIGANASMHRDLVAQIRADGHAIGNHTWNHPELWHLSAAQIRAQLRSTDRIIGRTTCMRPPYGATNAAVARIVRSVGKAHLLWNVDTIDWSRPGSAVIEKRLLSGAHNGADVLMHDGGGPRAQTVEAVRRALPKLIADGWEFRAIPQCALP